MVDGSRDRDLGPPAYPAWRRRRHQHPPLKRRIVERSGQWPSQSLTLGAAHIIAHRRRERSKAPGNRPDAQTCSVVQPQNLSNFAHGQPPVYYREPSPKTGKGPTAGGLSRVAQLRGSDPPNRSSKQPGSRRSATGITVHFFPESMSSFGRNRCPVSAGIRRLASPPVGSYSSRSPSGGPPSGPSSIAQFSHMGKSPSPRIRSPTFPLLACSQSARV